MMLADRIKVHADGTTRYVRYRATFQPDNGRPLIAFGRTHLEAVRRVLSIIDAVAADPRRSPQALSDNPPELDETHRSRDIASQPDPNEQHSTE